MFTVNIWLKFMSYKEQRKIKIATHYLIIGRSPPQKR